ncbi:MAG: hypothetical protein MPN21_13585 [Thermoanaerobaculia bacterium]|nr:hypothetical protein [Thermoanaerobaculia bacterium]
MTQYPQIGRHPAPGEEAVFSPWLDEWLDHARHLLESVTTRTVLSLLILVSVLPPSVLGMEPGSPLYALFLLIFGPEFLVRVLLLERRRRQRRMYLSETVVMAFDLVAIASFLPLASGTGLRFLRLARLLLLISYWRDLLLDLWRLVSSRERRYQVFLVLVLGVILALGSAVILVEVGVEHDYDGDEELRPEDQGFLHVFWWSFRQIQDPGNLVSRFDHPVVVAVSLLLTFAGLLLFSFFIGIGTNLVAELVERSRSQPLSLRMHTVILGLTPYASIMLRELAEIYRKNLRPYRGAILAEVERPDELADPQLRYFDFRHGDPGRTADLERVALGRAKRVIIVGDESRHPDAVVIAAILAARRVRHDVPIYPDLEHERNFHAARAAGGVQTHLVGSGSMLGYFVAQNVAYPGVQRLYRELLRSAGCEIYTYLFSRSELQRWRRNADATRIDPLTFHEFVFERHDITLLGFFVHPEIEAELEDADLLFLANPVHVAACLDRDEYRCWRFAFDDSGRLRRDVIRGVVGIAVRFRNLEGLGRGLVEGRVRRDLQVRKLPEDDGSEPILLKPPRKAPKRVLILGAGQRVPRVVMELVGLFRDLDISIVADAEEDWVNTSHDVRIMLSRAHGAMPDWEKGDDDIMRLFLTTTGVRPHSARITIMQADWTHGHRLSEGGAVTLEAADVILLLPTYDPATSSDRSDGRTALDCLHLANLEQSGTVHFRPGVQILALVRDPSKGELLESRLATMVRVEGASRAVSHASNHSSGRPRGRYSIISRELTRHRYIVQNVFVRGLNAIYLELLSAQGQYLSRLLPRDERGKPLTGTFDPVELTYRLMARDLVLVGYEHRSPDAPPDSEPRVVIDPRDLKNAGQVPWNEVEALYVLGEGATVASFEPMDCSATITSVHRRQLDLCTSA